MKLIKIININIIVLTIFFSCINNKKKNFEHTYNDSTVILDSNCVDLHSTGCYTKVIFPSKQHLCIDSLTEYFIDHCDGRKLKLHVPCNFLKTEYFQYTEGEILSIHYPDSSQISILCGSLTTLSVSDKKNNGRYDKKVTIQGFQICYYDVPRHRLELFNKAFDLLYDDID
jgi:hypothetical protein